LIKVVEVGFPIVGSLVAKHKAIASYQRWRAAINYQQGQKLVMAKTPGGQSLMPGVPQDYFLQIEKSLWRRLRADENRNFL